MMPYLCLPWPAAICLLVAVIWQLLAVPQNEIFIAINALGGYLPSDFWHVITLLGDTQVALCLLSVLLIKHPIAVLNIVASIPVGALLSVTLKAAFAAPRPGDILDPSMVQGMLGPLSGNSFPSGHTLSAFCTACSFWFALRLVKSSQSDFWLYQLSLGFAVLIGLSRIMLGVHWPVDTLAGASLGWFAGLSGALILLRYPALQHSAKVLRGVSLALCLASLHLTLRATTHQVATASMLWVAICMPWVNLLWQLKRYVEDKTMGKTASTG